MVAGVSNGLVIPINASALANKIGATKGPALDIEHIPQSKVKLEAQYTGGSGKGLKIDIKA